MIVSLTALKKAKKGVFFISLICLTACTSIPTQETSRRYAHLAPQHTLQDIPYFPQIEDQCGPASLATLLVMRGIDVSPEQLRGKIYIPDKQGAVTTEIVARARQYGLLAYVLVPTLSDVLAEINAGNPVLVMQNLAFNWMPRWHFSVAIAYNLEKQTISLRSGNEVQHEVGFDLFEKTWRRAHSWAMVIVPADQLPATATETRMVGAANALEQVGEIVPALSAYKALLAAWPDNAMAKFGAGNSAYALGHYDEAEQFFLSYLDSQAEASAGWNNLAYAYLKRGCTVEAKKAITCAARMDPENSSILDSYREISKSKKATPKQACQLINCPVI